MYSRYIPTVLSLLYPNNCVIGSDFRSCQFTFMHIRFLKWRFLWTLVFFLFLCFLLKLICCAGVSGWKWALQSNPLVLFPFPQWSKIKYIFDWLIDGSLGGSIDLLIDLCVEVQPQVEELASEMEGGGGILPVRVHGDQCC